MRSVGKSNPGKCGRRAVDVRTLEDRIRFRGPTRRGSIGRGTRTRGASLFLVVSLALSACGSSTSISTSPSGSDPVPGKPLIESFAASPESVRDGEVSELSWKVSDPDATVRIDPLGQDVSGNSITVRPVATTTYTLTVSNRAGTSVATTVVRVGSRATATVTTPGVATGDAWVDATSNLLGMESWCGNLAFVSARPDRDQILTGVAGQGLFANDPGSSEWVPFGRGSGSAPLDHRTSAIVYDPDAPENFWESGYFGLGPPPNATASSVNRTIDGGATFVRLGDAPPADLVSVDFSDPQRGTLLVGNRGQPRVFLSTDAGVTWSDISAGLPTSLGEASFPQVVDARTFLLGSHKGDRGDAASPGVFRTTDAGNTWERVFDEGVSGPPLVSADGGIYWVLDDGGVVASTDGGANWTVLAGRGPAGGGRRGRIVELPDRTWLSMGVEQMVVSRDQGTSWQTVGPSLPRDPSGFTYSPIRKAVYVWQNYCDFQAGPNPVVAESIMRLDLDLGP